MLSACNVPLVFTMCACSCFACLVETESVLFEVFLRMLLILCCVKLLILSFLFLLNDDGGETENQVMNLYQEQ